MKNRFTLLILISILSLHFSGILAQNNMNGQGNTKKITGMVTDQDGEPIIGATVIIKGTITGSMTDLDGNYSIDAKEGDVLEFRFVGYSSQERDVRSGTVINVVMAESSVSLDDVVIIGYGQQKKESVVSSINTITSAELAMPNRNLKNNLAGQVAGIISIQRSGEPGNDGAEFWIRGQGSYMGGTAPLVLVDGIPRSMDDIDVDEIETFSVLKDAAATAVYGSEGANGVVLITSKRGVAQKTRVSFNAQYSLVTPTRMPELLPSYDYLALYNEGQWNEAGNPSMDNFRKTYSDELLDMYRNGTDTDLYPNVNWMDLLSNHTESQRYTLNLRGGSERFRFFVSGAYYSEDGIFKSNPIEKYDANIDLQRFNLRSNIDMDLSPSTRMSVDISGQYLTRNNPGSTSDNIFKMITRFPTHYIPMYYSDGTASEHRTYDPGMRANPYNMLNNSGYVKRWDLNAQSKLTLEQGLDFITKGLSWRGTFSFDATSFSKIKRSKTANTFYATDRDVDGELIKTEIHQGTALSNPAYDYSGGQNRIYLETSFNYKRLFSQKHDVTGLILYMQKSSQYQNIPEDKRSVTMADLQLLPYKKQSVVARATYAYDTRYMLEASFGATGSENFAEGHRWGIFPAVGAAWFVSHEQFMRPVENYLSKLKIRTSFGITGNDEVGTGNDRTRFPYRESLSQSGSGYNFGLNPGDGGGTMNGYGGIIEDNFATPNLIWEVERKFNVGLDLGLFRGSVDMTVDWFYNHRDNILIRRNTTATAAGFRKDLWQNFGITTNKGVDASLIVKQNIGRLNLSFRGNLTYAKNTIEEYDEIPQVYGYQAITGTSINQPFVYIAEGLYTPDDFDITQNPDGSQRYTLKGHLPKPGTSVMPGDIKYQDLNQDGKIDSEDRTYVNNLYPKDPQLVYGFGLNAEWKGIFAGIFFQGVARASVNLLTADNFMPFNNGIDGSSARKEALDRWTFDDPYNQNVLYPRMHSQKYEHNTMPSTWWYRSGSFLRLKNVEVGYEFNRQLIRKIHLQNLRIYLQGTNLAVWDKVKYWDPEIGDQSSGSKYPISGTWTVGLELTF